MRGKRARQLRAKAHETPITDTDKAEGVTWRTVYRRFKRNYTRGH